MQNLKIYIYGTKYFIDHYATGLISDCERLGYDLTVGIVPDADTFSHINHYIHREMVRVVRQSTPNDRILFLDPECRICLLYTSPSPRDGLLSRMPSSA